VSSATTLDGVASKPARLMSLSRREALEGYLYLTPWVIGFIAFVGGPMLASLVLSLTNYHVVGSLQFLGLENYVRALTDDHLFWDSLKRTFYYTLLVVPLGITGALLAAMLLNQNLAATTIYRTLFFLPSLTPVVATAILWRWIFNADVGVLNYLLWAVGIEGPGWLNSTEWAIPTLVIITLWGTIGGNTMIIFLAGLQGVPQDLQEAAAIDGANALQRFRHVTLPMLSPTVFFNLVLGIIGGLKVFALAYVATDGGPAYATWFYALHIFAQAFKYFEMGYASALAWMFFVVMLVFTYLQFRWSSTWVYYAGEVK